MMSLYLLISQSFLKHKVINRYDKCIEVKKTMDEATANKIKASNEDIKKVLNYL